MTGHGKSRIFVEIQKSQKRPFFDMINRIDRILEGNPDRACAVWLGGFCGCGPGGSGMGSRQDAGGPRRAGAGKVWGLIV